MAILLASPGYVLTQSVILQVNFSELLQAVRYITADFLRT